METKNGQIALYQTDDGKVELEVRMEQDSVWLRQEQMSELFGRERSVITKHLRNIFVEGELEEESNVQNLHIAGSDKPVKFYNLDVVISVGYRVKSVQGTRFRQWATQRLREYLVHEHRRQICNFCHRDGVGTGRDDDWRVSQVGLAIFSHLVPGGGTKQPAK